MTADRRRMSLSQKKSSLICYQCKVVRVKSYIHKHQQCSLKVMFKNLCILIKISM